MQKDLHDRLDSVCTLFNSKFVTLEEFSSLKADVTVMKSDIEKNTTNLSVLSARMDNYEQQQKEIDLFVSSHEEQQDNVLHTTDVEQKKYDERAQMKNNPHRENEFLINVHNRSNVDTKILKFNLLYTTSAPKRRSCTLMPRS